MSKQQDDRRNEGSVRTGAQVGALLLAVFLFVVAAYGAYLIYRGFIVRADAQSSGIDIVFNFDLTFGALAFVAIVPGILLVLLFIRITKARVITNGICVAVTWLAFLMVGYAFGAWQGWIHIPYMALVVVPALYTACVVGCAESIGSHLNAGPDSIS